MVVLSDLLMIAYDRHYITLEKYAFWCLGEIISASSGCTHGGAIVRARL